MPDPWNPEQYARFRSEREQPFHDLLALVRPCPEMSVVDLGCGTGALTLQLHRTLHARETVGVDNSQAMLVQAPQAPGLRFELRDIVDFAPAEPVDLVFSNAALHWLPHHGELLAHLRAGLRPGGQIAVQMPANDDHASHVTAGEVAKEHEFKRHLDGFVARPPLHSPSQYAAWLHHLGFATQHVRLQVYTHLLPSREEVVEWVRGTLLTDYQRRLRPDVWERFLERYRELLLPQLPDRRPYLYTYPRILFWGQLPS
ncbi:MAG TPA: methyltransferase domain-containing protein [Myxococcales bacterium]|nr:methyltransferase domain-containing protein [Myxococcales bacterium]